MLRPQPITLGTLLFACLAALGHPAPALGAAPSSPLQDQAELTGLETEIDAIDAKRATCMQEVAHSSRKLMHRVRSELFGRYLLTLSGPPLTRIYANITTPQQAQSIPLDWDPLDGRGVARAVSLARERSWCVNFSSDPVTTGDKQTYLVHFEPERIYIPASTSEVGAKFAEFLVLDRLIVKLDQRRRQCESTLKDASPAALAAARGEAPLTDATGSNDQSAGSSAPPAQGAGGDPAQPEVSVGSQELAWFQSAALASSLISTILKAIIDVGVKDSVAEKLIIQSAAQDILIMRPFIYANYQLSPKQSLLEDLSNLQNGKFKSVIAGLCASKEELKKLSTCETIQKIGDKYMNELAGTSELVKQLLRNGALEAEIEKGLTKAKVGFLASYSQFEQNLSPKLKIRRESDNIVSDIYERISKYAFTLIRASVVSPDLEPKFCENHQRPDSAPAPAPLAPAKPPAGEEVAKGAPAPVAVPPSEQATGTKASEQGTRFITEAVRGHLANVNSGPRPPNPKEAALLSVRVSHAPPPSFIDAASLIQPQEAFGGLRSSTSAVAVDVMQILAEIALERAKSKALSLLSEKLASWVCEDLTIPAELAKELTSADEPPNPPLLPQTCQTLRNLRIQELASSGKTLLSAISHDIAMRTFNRINHAFLKQNDQYWVNRHLALSLRLALDMALRLADESSSVQTHDIQLLFLGFARDLEKMSKLVIDPQGNLQTLPEQQRQLRPAVCSIQLAFAILGECTNSSAGRCDARRIDDMLRRPNEIFNINLECQTVLSEAGVGSGLKLLKPFLTRSLAVLVPTRGMTVRQQLRIVIDLVFETAEYLLDGEGFRTESGGQPPLRLLVQALHRITLALMTQDAQEALLGLVQMFELNLRVSERAKLTNFKPYTEARAMLEQIQPATQILLDEAKYLKSRIELRTAQLDKRRADAKFKKAMADANQVATEMGAETKATQPAGPGNPVRSLNLVNKAQAVEVELKRSKDALAVAEKSEQEANNQLKKDQALHDKLVPELAKLSNNNKDIKNIYEKFVDILKETEENRNISDDNQLNGKLTKAQEELEQQGRSINQILNDAKQKLDSVQKESLEKINSANSTINRALLRATQVLAAVGSYAQHYATGEPDSQQIQAQRAARKKAIESLIDQATSRTNRQGDVIVSLGANVGFAAGVQWTRRLTGEPDKGTIIEWQPGGVLPQLTLPLGIAVQRLPSGHASSRCFFCQQPWGGFIQLSPIDLGQFLSFSSNGSLATLDWQNAFMIGLQAGPMYSFSRKGRSMDAIQLAFDLRYSPGVRYDPATQPGILRFSVALSYYVPFFDFN